MSVSTAAAPVALEPRLTRATITGVNDTAITVSIRGRLGVITVPRRWVFTDRPLSPGVEVEFYFSYMVTAASASDTESGARRELVEGGQQ